MWWRGLCCGKNHFYPKMISLGAFSHSFCRQKIWTVARSLETPILYIVAKRSLKNYPKNSQSDRGGGQSQHSAPPLNMPLMPTHLHCSHARFHCYLAYSFLHILHTHFDLKAVKKEDSCLNLFQPHQILAATVAFCCVYMSDVYDVLIN